MPDIEDMTPGQVLADANVSDFIGSMGLAIAEAQTALDENSVAQIPAFAQQRDGLNGRSLFDLGLSPAFYHYQHADLSVSLQLQLRVERTFGLDIGANFNMNDASTGNSTDSSSSTSTESGSSTRSEHREARLTVAMTTTGALTVNGNNFQLTGENPLARMSALAEALRNADNSGIQRALPIARTTPVNPTCNPASDQIVCTPNAVTFLNTTASFAIIRISELPAANDTFVFSTGASGVSVTVPRQADLTAQANEAAARIRAAGSYQVVVIGQGDVLQTVKFDHDDAAREPANPPNSPTNAVRLNEAADIIKATGIPIDIKGYCDRSGPRRYNSNSLSVGRIDYVRRELTARGVSGTQIPPSDIVTLPAGAPETPPATGGNEDNVGEDKWARNGVADGTRNADHRMSEILVGNTPNKYLIIRGTPINRTQIGPDRRTGGTGNGFVFVGTAVSNRDLTAGNHVITIKTANFPVRGAAVGAHAAHSPEAYAANLASDVNANTGIGVRAWATGNVCNLANNGDSFEMILATTETRNITMASTEDVTVTTQFSRSTTSAATEATTSNRTVAVGATVGLRFGRQYETNITGNSSISARLVSIPAPPEFLEQIKAFLEE